MKKITQFITFFVALLFITGCSGPSPKEIAGMEILIGPSVILLLLVVTIIFYWISGSDHLRLNKKMGLQFLIIFALSVIISLILNFLLPYMDGDMDVGTNLFKAQLSSLFIIPFLLFFTALLLAVLPTKYTFYLPTSVIVIYYVSAFLVFTTNKRGLDLTLAPFFSAWFVMAIIFVISIAFITGRYRGKNNKNKV